MHGSTQRIITTHVGSLPRPPHIVEAMRRIEAGADYDRAAFAADVERAVQETVKKQIDIGLDVVTDGEMGKLGFINYVNERLAGFEEPKEAVKGQWAESRETASFPEFYEWVARLNAGTPPPKRMSLVCTAPITYRGKDILQRDIDTLKKALKQGSTVEAFMPSISPATVAGYHKNVFYKSDEEFLFAVADAMHEEYKQIVDAGFLVQIDDPRLVTHYLRNPKLSLEEWTRWAEKRIEALNHALRGIPEDRIRHHTCYGINMGPRVHDLEMKHIIGLMLKIRAGGYSFEAANPRHEHEWRLWESAPLPENKVIIPGLVTQSTYVVEHPELVAERIMKFAGAVGRERVIASADCGFASSATADEIPATVAWAKLSSLVEGARLASAQLWKRAA